MIEVRCPECGAFYQVDDSLAGELVSCAECGAAFQTPASARGEVIDVRAEVIGGEEEPEPRASWPGAAGAGPGRNRPHGSAGPGGAWVYTWNLNRQNAPMSPACCSLGCIAPLILVGLAIVGLFSLFS